MNIAIVGTGYVGLITGVSLAKLGHKVICIDTAENKVSMIQKGESPFFEPHLEQLLKKNMKYHIVVVKSTVLPGVTEKVVKPIIEKYSNKKSGEWGLCMNPEFLREGNAIEDALHPDRIVIGQYDKKSGREFAKIYKKIS